LVIVTRYFGGTLLGKGGLIRAYTESAKVGIEAAEIFEVIEYSLVNVSCEYNIKDRVLFFLDKNNIKYIANYTE